MGALRPTKQGKMLEFFDEHVWFMGALTPREHACNVDQFSWLVFDVDENEKVDTTIVGIIWSWNQS